MIGNILYCYIPATLVVVAIMLTFPVLTLWVAGILLSAAAVHLLTGGEKF